jgi:hypothetical protein
VTDFFPDRRMTQSAARREGSARGRRFEQPKPDTRNSPSAPKMRGVRFGIIPPSPQRSQVGGGALLRTCALFPLANAPLQGAPSSTASSPEKHLRLCPHSPRKPRKSAQVRKARKNRTTPSEKTPSEVPPSAHKARKRAREHNLSVGKDALGPWQSAMREGGVGQGASFGVAKNLFFLYPPPSP